MGGRRAADLTRIVGKAKPVRDAKRKLTKAVSAKDPKAIAGASARLIASSHLGLQAVRYGLKLSSYISESRSELSKKSTKERNESLRSAWSSIKKRDGIRTSPEVDAAITNAASAAFRKRR